MSSDDARPENVSRRRSLALGRSEHDGRLMARRDGDAYAAVRALMTMLIACVVIVITASAAAADPSKDGSPTHTASGAASIDPWAAHIADAAKRFAIPERWIRAVMAVESVGDAAALSPKGAIGLMQIMPTTWDQLRAKHGLGNDPWQPRENILAGVAYLREMHDRYGAVAAMLGAYNAGPARYDEHLANGRALPAETVDYIARIMPMIDDPASVTRIASRSSRTSWSLAPLFVARSSIDRDDDSETAGISSGRPSSAPAIVDLSALVPPSDGLFVRRPKENGERR